MASKRLFCSVFGILLLSFGGGQLVFALDTPINDTSRHLSVSDSLISNDFGLKIEKQNVGPSHAGNTCLVEKYFRNGASRQTILSIPKGSRPDPATYLKRRCIRRHLKDFKAGASCIITKEAFDCHDGDSLGKADNSQFVMTKSEMDSVLIKSHGNLIRIENELGIPVNTWKNKILIRIDILKPKRLRLRMPSGNEAGVNELWLPGGYLPTGYKEAVVDRIPKGSYTATVIEILQ